MISNGCEVIADDIISRQKYAKIWQEIENERISSVFVPRTGFPRVTNLSAVKRRSPKVGKYLQRLPQEKGQADNVIRCHLFFWRLNCLSFWF